MNWHDFTAGADVDERTRNRWAEDMAELVRHGDDCAYTSSGNRIVIAMRVGDEICVFDAYLDREANAELGQGEPPRVTRIGGRT